MCWLVLSCIFKVFLNNSGHNGPLRTIQVQEKYFTSRGVSRQRFTLSSYKYYLTDFYSGPNFIYLYVPPSLREFYFTYP